MNITFIYIYINMYIRALSSLFYLCNPHCRLREPFRDQYKGTPFVSLSYLINRLEWFIYTRLNTHTHTHTHTISCFPSRSQIDRCYLIHKCTRFLVFSPFFKLNICNTHVLAHAISSPLLPCRLNPISTYIHIQIISITYPRGRGEG